MFWRQTVEDPYVQPQREPPKPPYHDECDREFEFFGSWPLKEIEEMQSDLSIWINSYYKDNYWENAESDSDWDKEYEELEPHDHSDDTPPDYAALIDERMTAAQKQAIVDYLGDWCLYSDWDAMVATFPLKAHRHTAFILAVISKDIFQNLVADPFYYMDLGDEWEGNHEALPTPLGRELYKLWQNMKRVDGSRAAEWRASTVQMMNKYLKTNGSDSDLNGLRNYREGKIRPMEANDRTIGIRSYNTREAYINRLVKNMLAPDSLIFPMRPQDDPQKEQLEQYTRCRAQGLRKCYKRASDCAVRMWSLNHRIEFDANIHGIGPYKNGPRGLHELETPRKNWYPCRMNHCESIVDLPGRRTVMISWPAIWYILYDKRNKDGEIERVARRKAGYWEERDWWYVDEQGWSHEIAVPGSVLLAIPSEQKNSEFSSE
ncbi:hypothetical protein N7456_011006 [Penicillium angulare]|uniref:Uncharacterized protein n=1 Tax=Penicillium angulare TaxID=116970 RepID=A0A9W9JZN1_9EURO|nr:hypothetical protein N7456_011006 [Penicillium angulare]